MITYSLKTITGAALSVHNADGLFGIVVSDEDNQPGIATAILDEQQRRNLAKALLRGLDQ